jgi:hypothetical protein
MSRQHAAVTDYVPANDQRPKANDGLSLTFLTTYPYNGNIDTL